MVAIVLENNSPSLRASACSVEYRDIVGFPHYRVGSDGSVWSEHEHGPKRPRGSWKRLQPTRNESGYLQVNLYKDRRHPYSRKVHRLVAEAFLGPSPKGMEVCHNNGFKCDNYVTNLRYDTHKSNGEDATKHGSWSRSHGKSGVTNPAAKLNELQVAHIRRLYPGVSRKDLAALFEVSYSLVSKIVTNKLWSRSSFP